MPLDRRAQRFLEMFAAAGPARAYGHPSERRGALQDLARIAETEPMELAEVRDGTIPGPGGPLPYRLYVPNDASTGPGPGLVFFHGGGWVAGGFDTHDGVCRRLAQASGCRVVAIDYRLAPEHPFPAAVHDARAAVSHVSTHAADFGIDPGRLGVAGDSAGANLAAHVCQSARHRGGPAIALQLLICPILDVESEAPSRRDFAEGYFLERATMERDLFHYCPGGTDLGDPRLSPALAVDVADLPPALIHTAEYDPFRDEGEAYGARLSEAGVAARVTRHPGMIHYFYAMPRTIPYAIGAMEEIGAGVREAI
jgi:acetyl esterase